MKNDVLKNRWQFKKSYQTKYLPINCRVSKICNKKFRAVKTFAKQRFNISQYIYIVNHPLNNPVYSALCTGDVRLGRSIERAKYFHEDVSPFVGFPEDYENGFEELHTTLPLNRNILYASRKLIETPRGWQLKHHVPGLQFLYNRKHPTTKTSSEIIELTTDNVDEMMALAALTKPGPFARRTIAFGHYYGIFRDERLIVMTGQRLHPHNFAEVSAVCTHPNWLGNGFAAALINHQLNIICSSGQVPFLHVRSNNQRAIDLYERLGFIQNGVMNFYFLQRV